MAQMPFTPPPDDASVGMLKAMFGPVVDVLLSGADPNTVSAASSLIATLFGYFNSGILVVAAVIAGYVASMGAINTATDGEAFGKAWSAVWTPVRFVAGGAVLLPSASGYSFIQMLVLMISLWSAGFASNLYKLGMSMGVLSPAGIVSSSGNVGGGLYGLREFATQYVAVAYCARSANLTFADPGAGTAPAVSADATMSGSSTKWDKQSTTDLTTEYTFFVRDRNTVTNLGGGAPFCGTVSLKVYAADPEAAKDSTGTQGAIDSIRAAVSAAKVQAAIDLMNDIDGWVATWPANISQPGWDQVNSATLNNFVDARNAQIVSALQTSMTGGEANVNSSVQAYANALVQGGWAMAGGWYQRVGAIRRQLNEIAGGNPGTVTAPNFYALPKSASADLVSASVNTISETIQSKSSTASGFEAKSFGEIGGVVPKDSASSLNVGSINAEMNARFDTITTRIQKWLVSVLLGSGSDVDAVSRMKMSGDVLTLIDADINAGLIAMKTAGTTLRVVAAGVDSLSPVNIKSYEAAASLDDWLDKVPGRLLSRMLTFIEPLAFYFGSFLPALPYSIFMIVVVGWVLAVFQTMLAAPLWVIMHMRPSQTFVGSEAQGYLLLLALFVRPALAVIGLFAAMLVADPVVDYIVKAFFTTSGAISSGTTLSWFAGIFQFFWTLSIFGLLLLPVLYAIYSLPQTLPDHVLRWINAGVHDLGATAAANEMRGGVTQGAPTPPILGGGGGGRTGRIPGAGRPGGGDGTRGDAPRLGAGGQAHVPVNAGGQGVAPPNETAAFGGGLAASSSQTRSSAPDSARPARAQAAASGDQPLSGGTTPPTRSQEVAARGFSDRVSDTVGVGLGNAVLGVGRTAAGIVRGAASSARSSESVPGAVLGLATGAIGGGVAAAADAGLTTATEAIGAFREGADARIKAMREPGDTPVNGGDQAASNKPEPKDEA
ncbi:DotA/TraY family protein [Ralstonia nicotianae]